MPEDLRGLNPSEDNPDTPDNPDNPANKPKKRIKALAKGRAYALFAAITVVCCMIDQFTKRLAVEHLLPVNTIPLIKDVLHLTYVENTGAAFGMMKEQRWIFMSISSIAIIALAIYMCVRISREDAGAMLIVSISLIIGGGIGNMIDRILMGYVVDFIDFRLINFAVFNGADTFVCVGAGLLALYVLLFEDFDDDNLKKKKIK